MENVGLVTYRNFHIDVLTVDKHAIYYEIEVASAIDDRISEDDKTWVNVEL